MVIRVRQVDAIWMGTNEEGVGWGPENSLHLDLGGRCVVIYPV
jgi:hypothetical protein